MDTTHKYIVFLTVAVSLVYSIEENKDFSLKRHHLLPRFDRCGKIRAPGAFAALDLGLTGKATEAIPGQFPWFAQLGYDNFGRMEYTCFGALISSRYIITTIKCAFDHLKGVPVTARLGVSMPSINSTVCRGKGCSSTTQEIQIEKIRINEAFRLQWRHDVALIKLKEPVRVNEYIFPVCLPSGSEAKRDLTGKTVFVTEWTKLEHDPLNNYMDESLEESVEDDLTIPNQKELDPVIKNGQLQYYSHSIAGNSDCQMQFREAFECPACSFDTENVLCMDVESMSSESNSHNCLKQVGLPVTYITESPTGVATAYLAGITIYSYRNCEVNVPVVATRVSDNLNFILENMDY